MLKETKKLDGSMIELLFEVPSELFLAREAEALQVLSGNLEIDGFRKGKVPIDVVKKHLPEMTVLEKMAELAIGELYPKTVLDEKIPVIGRPEVTITKLSRGDNLHFSVKTPTMPEVTIPDYKKIAKSEWEELSETVTDEDVAKAILDIRKMRAHQKMHEDNVPHDTHSHAEIKDEDLPALDDTFVKTLGNFQTVAEFEAKLRDNLTLEKKVTNKDKNRSKMIEAIGKETKVDIPETLIEGELQKMLYELKDTIERAGLPFDEYYKHIGKTEESVKQDLRPDAIKRATIELALFEIAKKEKLTPSMEEIEKEAEMILARYPGADKTRALSYAEHVMTNERVFQFLEITAQAK